MGADAYTNPVINTLANQLPSLYGKDTHQTASLTYNTMKRMENEERRGLEELLTGYKGWRDDPALNELYHKTIRDSAITQKAGVVNSIRGMAKMRVNSAVSQMAMQPPEQVVEQDEGNKWADLGAQAAGTAAALGTMALV